ncbi:MAG: hemerythrin domain-containing protein [Ignavibacteria bacterium]|nr:hemerythrin domain-containing protein [Ignavibacteria bacterium]
MRIAAIFDTVKADLEQHMIKEEQILFPYVTRSSLAARNAKVRRGRPQFGTVRNPITMMETEHENVRPRPCRNPHLEQGLCPAGGRLRDLLGALQGAGRIRTRPACTSISKTTCSSRRPWRSKR